jgi:cell division protein YceG involved in septum cleavage
MRRLGLLLLLGIAAVGAFAAWLDQDLSVPYRRYKGDSVIVDIPHGMGRWGIASLLAKNRVIRSVRILQSLAPQALVAGGRISFRRSDD